MKPIMRQEIRLKTQKVDEHGELVYDPRRGDPIIENVYSKARVVYEIKFVRDAEGASRQTVATVDVPASLNVSKGLALEYPDINGEWKEGQIVNIISRPTPAGTSNYYRTIEVGG